MTLLKPIKNQMFVKWLRFDLVEKTSNLEFYSSERFFDSNDIYRVMCHSCGHGLVLTHLLDPVAYVLYLKNNDQAHLVNLVVHPKWRRFGHGTILIDQIKKRVNRITATLKDTNLTGHLFLKNNDFVAHHVLRNHFSEELAKDAYAFEFKK